jgi:hypothetical protein
MWKINISYFELVLKIYNQLQNLKQSKTNNPVKVEIFKGIKYSIYVWKICLFGNLILLASFKLSTMLQLLSYYFKKVQLGPTKKRFSNSRVCLTCIITMAHNLYFVILFFTRIKKIIFPVRNAYLTM